MALKVEFEELVEIASDIRTNKEECDGMIDDTAAIVDGLVGDGFEGSAADAFNDKFEEVKKNLKEAMESFEDMAEMLDSISQSMQEMDDDLASQVSGS